jgi:CTP synthase (UTP-ammonia lyase)
VISELPEQKKLEGLVGGTMRLGAQDVQVSSRARSRRSCTTDGW